MRGRCGRRDFTYVTIHDPASFALGAAALAVIAMTAAVLPLRRVFRVNPVDVIRND